MREPHVPWATVFEGTGVVLLGQWWGADDQLAGPSRFTGYQLTVWDQGTDVLVHEAAGGAGSIVLDTPEPWDEDPHGSNVRVRLPGCALEGGGRVFVAHLELLGVDGEPYAGEWVIETKGRRG